MTDSFFLRAYGNEPICIEKSPGRVNLIGEHIDYNGGFVLPCALPLGLTIGFQSRNDDRIRVASRKFDGLVEADLFTNGRNTWAGHALGAVLYAHREGLLTGGADIAIEADLPDGAGLSSSAALVVGILKAARSCSNSSISNKDIAVLARRVENEFIGVPCGIMDQMAVALAEPGQAVVLDTKTLDYSLIDLPADFHFAVLHSGISRQLTEGRYAERKLECDRAKELLGVEDLCLMDQRTLERARSIPDPFRLRALHCATEHQRTLEAASALKSGLIKEFGGLMDESHKSMRDQFQMSLPEIDRLVESCKMHGAIGARLTGGGFGGCVVACVSREILDKWRVAVLNENPLAYFVC